MYIRMMGAEGLKAATETAILSASIHQRPPQGLLPTLCASETRMEKAATWLRAF